MTRVPKIFVTNFVKAQGIKWFGNVMRRLKTSSLRTTMEWIIRKNIERMTKEAMGGWSVENLGVD